MERESQQPQRVPSHEITGDTNGTHHELDDEPVVPLDEQQDEIKVHIAEQMKALDTPKWKFKFPSLPTFKLPTYKETREYLKTRAFKNTFKSSVAFGLASLCTLVVPLGSHIGYFNFLTAMSITLTDMNLTMGGIVERFWIFLVTITLSCAFASLSLAVPSSFVIQSSLFICTFLFMYARAKLPPRWNAPFTLGQEAFVLSVIAGVRTGNGFGFSFSNVVVNNGLCMLIGATISLITTALVFPFSANELLCSEISSTFQNMTKFIDLNTKAFLLEDSNNKTTSTTTDNNNNNNENNDNNNNTTSVTIEEPLMDSATLHQELQKLKKAIDQNATKLDNWRHESELEIARSYFSNDDVSKLVFLLRNLLQHCSSMINCYSKESSLKNQVEPGKNKLLREILDAMAPAVKRVTIKCISTISTLRTYMDTSMKNTVSDIDPDVMFPKLIEELEEELNDLEQSTNQTLMQISRISKAIISSGEHVNSHDLDHLEIQAMILGMQELPSNINNGPWEAIFRVYFWTFTFRKFVVDLEKLTHFLHRIRRKQRIIKFPYWVTKLRQRQRLFSNIRNPFYTLRAKNKAYQAVETGSQVGNKRRGSLSGMVDPNSSPISGTNYPSPSVMANASPGFKRKMDLNKSLDRTLLEMSENNKPSKPTNPFARPDNPFTEDSKTDKEEPVLTISQNSLLRQLVPTPAGTIIAPEQTNTWGYKLWLISTMFTHSDEVLFAFKIALTMSVAALPFFLHDTRDLWNAYRGEWALFTITALSSVSVGGNAILSLYRILGTIFGAASAVVAALLCDVNPYGLFIFSFLFSFPMFHLKLNTQYPRLGIVTITTYVIVCYGRFNQVVIRHLPDVDHMVILAAKRSLTIICGVLLVMFATRFFFPSLARKQVRYQLNKTIHLFAQYFGMITSLFLRDQISHKSMKEANKLSQKLQIQLAEVQALIESSKSEPRLKGPFPVGRYQELVTSLSFILDRLNATKSIISEGFSSDVRQNLVIPLNIHRKEMINTLLIQLWLVAEACQSKHSLPMHLPNALKARNRLIVAFQKLAVLKPLQAEKIKDYMLFLAYIESKRDLIHEVHKMIHVVKLLYGEQRSPHTLSDGQE